MQAFRTMAREAPSRALQGRAWTDTFVLAVGLLGCAALLLVCRIFVAEVEEARLGRLEAGLSAQASIRAMLIPATPPGEIDRPDTMTVNLTGEVDELKQLAEQEPTLQGPLAVVLAAIGRASSPGGAARPERLALLWSQRDDVLAALMDLEFALQREVRALRAQNHKNWRLGVGTALLSSFIGLLLLALQRRKVLRGAQKQAAVATAQLRAVYTAAPIGLVLLDEALRIQRANPSFSSMANLGQAIPDGTSLRQVMPDLA